MGTPEFAATVLEHLCKENYSIIACITQPDKPSGRHMKLTPPPAKSYALQQGIPVFQPASLRTEEFLKQIRSWEPDLIITAAYGKILPQVILDVPTKGCINVHASLLPRYRGAAPVQWSIMNGDTVTGVTIMNMDAGMDTGSIISQCECPIDPDIGTEDLMDRLAVLGSNLLIETLPRYLSGEAIPTAQDDSHMTLSPPIRKEQGHIDWSGTAEEIHNQIRALSAWPGAYTYLNGERFKIYSSVLPENSREVLHSYQEQNGTPVPGTIVYSSKSDIIVACGTGCINLICVQPQSCRRMNACECAHNYHVGIRFGGETS